MGKKRVDFEWRDASEDEAWSNKPDHGKAPATSGASSAHRRVKEWLLPHECDTTILTVKGHASRRTVDIPSIFGVPND